MTIERAASQASPAVLRDVLQERTTLDDLRWAVWEEPGRAGVEHHLLWSPTSDDPSAAMLLRFEPGGHSDFHEHLGVELMMVLDGVLEHSDGQRFNKGDLVVEEPGSQHQMSSSEGCVVLAVRTKPTDPRGQQGT